MENREELLTPGTKQNEAEKSFGPFSPLEHDMEYRELLHRYIHVLDSYVTHIHIKLAS